MGSYQQYSLENASAVDLVVALYDGILRFLYAAGAAIERNDPEERHAASKRALEIIVHLQARLRMDVGGRPAQALSEFYATIFAEIMQASQSCSKAKFDHAIDCVRVARDAWREVAKDPEVNPAPLQVSRSALRGPSEFESGYGGEETSGSNWNA